MFNPLDAAAKAASDSLSGAVQGATSAASGAQAAAQAQVALGQAQFGAAQASAEQQVNQTSADAGTAFTESRSQLEAGAASQLRTAAAALEGSPMTPVGQMIGEANAVIGGATQLMQQAQAGYTLAVREATPHIQTLQQTSKSAISVNETVLNEMAQWRQELDDIKVQEMHGIIEEVTFSDGDARRSCKFLYLTNDQAQKLDMESMPRLREKLQIDKYQSVIRIIRCKFGTSHKRLYPNFEGRFPTKLIPELSDEVQEDVEHQVLMLANLILKLAINTRALVVGNETCDLLDAFIRVSAPFQRRQGSSCPFGILLFGRVPTYHLAAGKHRSRAEAFRKQCKSWNSRETRAQMEKALNGRFGDDRAYWPHEDLPSGDYTAIAFESLESNGKGGSRLAYEAGEQFGTQFMSSLAMSVSAIAIATYGTDKLEGVPVMQDMAASRGLPLMLFDSRKERSKTFAGERMKTITTPKAFAKEVGSFSDALHQVQGTGRVDAFNTSTLAFAKTVVNGIQARLKSAQEDETADSEESATAQRRMVLWKAIQTAKEAMASPDHGGAGDNEELQMQVQEITDWYMHYNGYEYEWEGQAMMNTYQEGVDDIKTAVDWQDFKDKLQVNWLKIRGCCFHFFGSAYKFAAKHPWIVCKDIPAGHMGGKILEILVPAPGFEQTLDNLEEAKSALLQLFNGQFQVDKGFKMEWTEEKFVANQEMWLAVYDILSCDKIKTGNIFDLKEAERVMNNMAQNDRLPNENNLQTLLLIRRAWTLHDLYMWKARKYKSFSRLSYLVILLLSIITVIVTVLYGYFAQRDEEIVSENTKDNTVLGLALAGTFVTGLTALYDPQRKWLQLRGGQFALEQEIWKLRMRLQVYSPPAALMNRSMSESRANKKFLFFLTWMQEKVQQSAGLKDTNFYAISTATDDIYKDNTEDGKPVTALGGKTMSEGSLGDLESPSYHRDEDVVRVPLKKSNTLKPMKGPRHLRHGQYEGNLCIVMTGDNGHSPATADEYIRYRLVPVLHMYQTRIRPYYRRKMFLQALVLILSVVSAFLASLAEPSWTAIIAAITGGITAWQEFSGVAKKLERYSNVAHGLGNILMWWQSLPDISQTTVANIEELFRLTEELISSEHTAWLSDAKLAREMAQGSEDKDGKGDQESQDKKAVENQMREQNQAKIQAAEASKSKMEKQVAELRAQVAELQEKP
mmetsp:Transcript_45158/g.96430  ORF Transcript_45158/g.96430 Transcript_45158/m.96430 type:complete len:1194 (-) Transcript_45158:40-3621(-)